MVPHPDNARTRQQMIGDVRLAAGLDFLSGLHAWFSGNPAEAIEPARQEFSADHGAHVAGRTR
jgi:hypothetical protein